MLKSPPMKFHHTSMKPLKKISGCITFLGHDIVDVYRAKCDRRCSRKRRAAQQSSNGEWCYAPRTIACVFFGGENHEVRLEGVLVEQDEVRVGNVRNELV